MGLKFQREDSLDKMFEEFAILPDQKEKVVEENKAIERFLKPEKKTKDKKNDQDD
ncbi:MULTISPECIES: SPJ_0845 family protein [Enterococcus]|uniref:SPJ_0845 family protein n=1 Tax=Enterococcus TaxID=1350 RepID=UPI0014856BC3|nr:MULTISPECIES: SPJ_0845 family protein [Enterococcus]